MAKANTPEPYRPAAASSPYTYTPVAGHELRRQMTTPAALAATFATCGGSGGAGYGGGWPTRNLGDDGSGDFRGCCAPRPGAAVGGGVGAVVSAVWAWIATGGGRKRRKMASMSRSGSSSRQHQYGHEEYAQNFDDGGAAGEPENLARSFSVRYARHAPSTDDGARRRG